MGVFLALRIYSRPDPWLSCKENADFFTRESKKLLNCLFYSPYTKTEHPEKRLGISRPTAGKYLDTLVNLGLLKKERIWRSNYYINTELVALLARSEVTPEHVPTELIRTVGQS